MGTSGYSCPCVTPARLCPGAERLYNWAGICERKDRKVVFELAVNVRERVTARASMKRLPCNLTTHIRHSCTYL
jgi:hypothetical protein